MAGEIDDSPERVGKVAGAFDSFSRVVRSSGGAVMREMRPVSTERCRGDVCTR